VSGDRGLGFTGGRSVSKIISSRQNDPSKHIAAFCIFSVEFVLSILRALTFIPCLASGNVNYEHVGFLEIERSS
jgi:hypothetical protein